MSQYVHIHRSSVLFSFGIVCSLGVCVGCILRLYVISNCMFGMEQVFLCIGVVFSAGAAIWLFYLFQSLEPVISLFNDRLELRSIWRPHQTVAIPRECILYVTTNALEPVERSDLIITVTAECFDRLNRLPIWRTTSGADLYFEFSNAQVSPSKAAAIITSWQHGISMPPAT